MYKHKWLENLYREKVAEWKRSGDRLSKRLFEAEYKEEIYAAFQQDAAYKKGLN